MYYRGRLEHQKTNWNNWNWNARPIIIHLKSLKSMNYNISVKRLRPLCRTSAKAQK